MASQILDFPADVGRWALADWVEKTMFLEEHEELSRASIERRFPTNFQPDASEVEVLYDEFRDRASASPKCYPFSISENEVITFNGAVDRRIYEFLTLISLRIAPYRSESRFNDVDPLFDLLVREAAKEYGGTGTDALRFGWPTRDGRPKRLIDAFPWISEITKIPLGNLETLKPTDKDAGVDIVAWKPFASGGVAFSVTLFQNTLGFNFERKASDIALSQWKHLLRIGEGPQIGLAFPFAVEVDSPSWDTMNWRAAVVLDRLRMCENLDVSELANFEPEWTEIADFNAQERAAIVTLLRTPPAPKVKRSKK